MILGKKHREAEDLSAAATSAAAVGRYEEAKALYAQAAQLEEVAFKEIPTDKIRTRSILSVSVASLFYKAQLLKNAERVIFRFLGTERLEAWAERQLRELLLVVTDEKLLAEELKQRYSGENITVHLRGGEIGSGTGPLDLILEKTAGFRSLLYRFAEWIGEYPLRTSGDPPKELQDLIQARATEPTHGSYKLEILLTEPLQRELFGKERVRPHLVSDVLFNFIGQLMQGERDKIEALVPEPSYRKALLELTNNITPRGRRLQEVGIYRRRDDKIESVYLTEALSEQIKDIIPHKPKLPKEQEAQRRGILRALHLDEHWLELAISGGIREVCDTVPDMLDDVVGPMVNHEVIVRGPARPRRGKNKVLVEDIELVGEM